jgi:biopolymer transport protein ExbD
MRLRLLFKYSYTPLVIVFLILLSGIVFAAACASHSSVLPRASQTQTTGIRPAKIQLNEDEMGTSDDLSLLRQKLAENFKLQKEQHVYKRGFERRTDLPEDERIEKTVFVKAERSIKLAEVTKIIETVEDAGGGPVLLPITVDERKARKIKPHAVRLCSACALAKDRWTDGEWYPNPLTLLVRLRQPNSTPPRDASGLPSISDFLISDGIPIGLPRAGDGSLALITISKDDDFALEEKPVERVSLEKEIRDRIKAKPASERVVFVKAAPDNTYGSLEDVYYAAFAAGAKRIVLDSSDASRSHR